MPTHADRAIHLKTPLADDVLLPRQVTGTERFSEPFRYNLQLLSEQGNVNPDEILGKTVCVSYDLPTGGDPTVASMAGIGNAPGRDCDVAGTPGSAGVPADITSRPKRDGGNRCRRRFNR